jgi:hypothetical protein
MNIVSALNSTHIIPYGILQITGLKKGNSNTDVNITIIGYIAIPMIWHAAAIMISHTNHIDFLE